MASILSILPRKTVRENINKDFSTRHGTPSLGIPRFSYLRSQLGKSEMQSSPVSLHDGEPAPQNSRGFVADLDNNASDDKLERRIKVAEGHVEVGRLLAFYQRNGKCYFLQTRKRPWLWNHQLKNLTTGVAMSGTIRAGRTFQKEELGKTDGSKNESVSIRPLHSCWMEIIKKLVGLSKLDLVMEMLDKSFSKSDGVEVLIDEDEAQSLYNLVLSIDCFSALKILLLLPYKGPQLQCLHVVDSTPPNNAIHSVDNGYELLILVLSSGVLKDVTTNPNFGKVLTYLCRLVGYLAQLCQEDLLDDKDGLDRKRVLVFCTILLPCFISQLVVVEHCLLAGFIVSQWMHTHSSLSLVDVVEASLRKYLEVQFFATGCESACESCGSLVYALSRLRGKARSMLESAISALPGDTAR